MDTGLFSVELYEILLGFKEKTEKDLTVRIDVTIENENGAFNWSNNNELKYSSSTFTPSKITDEVENQEEYKKYIVSFNDFMLTSSLIDLESEVINSLCNSFISIKVINESAPEAPPSKPAKGAPAVQSPSEEVMVECIIPGYAIFLNKNSVLEITESISSEFSQNDFTIRTINNDLDVDSTTLKLKIVADNDICEYALGAKILRWSHATLTNPPPQWGLQAPDVTDPKAKSQPTPEDLRKKYLENIEQSISIQKNICEYCLIVGGTGARTKNEGDDEVKMNSEQEESQTEMSIESKLSQFFPEVQLSNGKIFFDKEAAEGISIEENIRDKSSLWRGNFISF